MYGQYLALVITLSALLCVQSDVLMPFGVDAGDKTMDTISACDDFNFESDIDYNTTIFTKASICRSGDITMFGRGIKSYLFSVHSIKVQAGFDNGNVFYRSTYSENDLNQISSAVNLAFKDAEFVATRAVVVTWDKIKESNSKNLNSFQIIFVKNRTDTYLIYNYGQIDSLPVKCSFTDGRTDIEIAGCPSESNVDQPGRFMYRVKTVVALVEYGAYMDDKKMPSEKADCFELSFNFDLNYLYTTFDKTLICKSGSFSMNGKDGNYYQFNGHNVSVLAGEGNGEVYYRITSNAKDITILTSIVFNAYPTASFTANRALIVTWEKIRNKQTSELNTFQLILVTSGSSSFLIYNYDACDTRPVICNYPITPTSSDRLPTCPISSNVDVLQRYIYRVAPGPQTSIQPTTTQTTTKPNNQASGLTGVSGLICFGVIAVFATAYAFFDN